MYNVQARRRFSNHYILYFRGNHLAGDPLYNGGLCVMMIIIIIIITVIRQTAIIPVHNMPVSAKPPYVYIYNYIYMHYLVETILYTSRLNLMPFVSAAAPIYPQPLTVYTHTHTHTHTSTSKQFTPDLISELLAPQ